MHFRLRTATVRVDVRPAKDAAPAADELRRFGDIELDDVKELFGSLRVNERHDLKGA